MVRVNSGIVMYRDIAVQNCIRTCTECEAECERCVKACMATSNAPSFFHCIQLCRDTANICATAIKFLAQNSDYAQKICETCVDVCLACRDECARHEEDFCHRCADVCHKAAEECEKLSLQPV